MGQTESSVLGIDRLQEFNVTQPLDGPGNRDAGSLGQHCLLPSPALPGDDRLQALMNLQKMQAPEVLPL